MAIAAGSGDGCLLTVLRLREQTIGRTHVLCADFNSLLFSTRALLLPPRDHNSLRFIFPAAETYSIVARFRPFYSILQNYFRSYY
jgi:hypothetical protein